MYYSFTDGTVLDIPDMCGYCSMTTGGQHQPVCPLFQIGKPIISLSETKARKKHIFGQNIREAIRILKFDDAGNFIKEL